MKLLWFLVFLATSVLQTSIWPVNLSLVLIFLLNLIFSKREILLWSFLAGLLLDIFSHTILGVNALFFLTFSLLFLFYRQFIQFPVLGKQIILQYIFFTPFVIFSLFLSQVLRRSIPLGMVSFSVPGGEILLGFLVFVISYPFFILLSLKKQPTQLELEI